MLRVDMHSVTTEKGGAPKGRLTFWDTPFLIRPASFFTYGLRFSRRLLSHAIPRCAVLASREHVPLLHPG